MLTSLNRMIGMPVILGDRQLGSVELAVADAGARRLSGLVIRRGIGGARWVPAEGVELVGEKCVLIRMSPAHSPGKKEAGGRIALSTTGERVGEVTDALLRGDTLRLIALEVSPGPLYRIMGRSAYATVYQERAAQRAVIVPRLVTWAELNRTLGEGDDA